VDSVIGSIPFSFFSEEKSNKIIQDAYDKLVNNGYYSQVLYTKFNFKKFQKIFINQCTMKSLKNIPPEFIYHCRKVQ
jgi:phospholipid N-methyltransferase